MGWKRRIASALEAARREEARERERQRHRELRRAAVEITVAVAGLLAAAGLAADYLLPTGLRDDAEAAVLERNEMIVAFDVVMTFAHVTVQVDHDERELIFFRFESEERPGTPVPFTVGYENKGFAGGADIRCTAREAIPGGESDVHDIVIPNDGTAVDVDLRVSESGTFGFHCVRTTGIVERDRRGELYVFPTDVVLVASAIDDEAYTAGERVEYSITRDLLVSTDWTYDSEAKQITWTAVREATDTGTASSSYDQQRIVDTTIVPSDESGPMRFTDSAALAESERNAWISALIAGAAAGLLVTGIATLGRSVRRRPRRARTAASSRR